jgi:spermidine synthase
MDVPELRIPVRGDKFSLNASVKALLHHRDTEFQTIDIYDTDVFGKALLLDGHIQFTLLDEHAYHESLVQIPMLNLRSARRALVIGGGDGGVIRELCKHGSIERIDMVEIDPGVIESCKLALPEMNAGAFDDPRVTVYVEDAFDFVRRSTSVYDLIVADSTDVYENEEGGISEALFTEEFYRDCLRIMSEEGLLVTQADNLVFCPYSLEAILALFGRIFPRTGAYQALVPSFGGFSGFAWASKGITLSPRMPTVSNDIPLRYLNETLYAFAFSPLSF